MSRWGMAGTTRIETSTIGHSAENANGSLPPSGNATASASTGTAAAMTTPIPGSAGRMRRCSVNAAMACAAPASAANSASTGLASAASTAQAVARAGRRRCSASAVPIAGTSPSAKVSRPVNRLVLAAIPNHSAPSQASSPKRRCASDSNSAALIGTLIAATTWGVSSAPSGGKSTL